MRRRPALLLSLLLAAAATATIGVPQAAASKPCWRALFVDYGDGRIDKTYPVRCYRDAVRNLHEDNKLYGSAAEDIRRALAQAIVKLKRQDVPIGPNTNVPKKGGPRAADGAGGAGGAKKANKGFFYRVVHAIGPTSADSVPLPLLILAGLAFLLLAAAATSLALRRFNSRRGPPPSAP